MLPEPFRDIRRILAVRLDNIGDVVMLGPALRALRKAFPEAHITLMASPAGSQAAPLLPWIDETWVHRATWQDASGEMLLDPAREMDLVERLRAGTFDAAFIFTSFSQSPYPPAYACYLAGIPVRAGQSREFGGSILSHPTRPLADETHQVDRNLSLLGAFGLPVAGAQLELSIPQAAEERAEELLLQQGIAPREPFIVMAPGASCSARSYAPERFSEAADLITRETGLPILIVGGERDVELGRQVASACEPGRACSLAGETSIPDLAAVIARAQLVMCNNSGPMHIADAFERPQVVLYSGTDYESMWRPRRSPAVLLRRETDCSPCFAFRCPYGHECLSIQPAEVAREAGRLLARTAMATSEVV